MGGFWEKSEDARSGTSGGTTPQADRPPNVPTVVFDTPDQAQTSVEPHDAGPSTTATLVFDAEEAKSPAETILSAAREPGTWQIGGTSPADTRQRDVAEPRSLEDQLAQPSVPANPLQLAIVAAQAGNKPLATINLNLAIQTNPDDPIGWLWLAWLADSPAAALSALEQARIRLPGHTLIDQGFAWARGLQAFSIEQFQEAQPSESISTPPRIGEPVQAPSWPAATNAAEATWAKPTQEDPFASSSDSNWEQATEVNASDSGPDAGKASLEQVAQVSQELESNDRSPANADDAFGSPGQQTILAIDDSPTIRGLVSLSLSKCGYNVITASDGVDALDCMASCTPSLILLDIDMPRLNGYQLCKLIKGNDDMCHIPVIMLSGKDGMFDKRRGKKCGCDDYLTKPFESAALVKKVSEFLHLSADKQ